MSAEAYLLEITYREGGPWLPIFRLADEVTEIFNTRTTNGVRISAMRTGDLIYDFVLRDLGHSPWRLA